jgi:hypothetical protein
LFYAPPGWTIVGCDESGLELRGLAHYLVPLDNGKYMKVVLEGDIHWMHAQVMGLATGPRDKHNKLHTIIREDGSKRFIYAYIYGCWDDMAGEIILNCLAKAKRDGGDEGATLYIKFFGEGVPGERRIRKVGAAVREGFLTRIEGYGDLKNKIDLQVQKFGWVPGLDGRRIPIRSDHSALNFMIQSAGAIICKRWVCDAFDELSAKYKHGWDGQFVFGLWVHDELQVWCRNGLEEEVKEVLVRCAQKAGEPYGFRVRLDGEAKFGRTWVLHRLRRVCAGGPLCHPAELRGECGETGGYVLSSLIAGLLTWTLLEYLGHRFVAHWCDRICAHHEAPLDYSVGPSWSVVVGVLAVFWLLCPSSLFALGLTLGYAAYAVVHYLCHHTAVSSRALRALRRNHNVHHHVDERTNYGVSSPLWDVVFGTYRGKK